MVSAIAMAIVMCLNTVMVNPTSFDESFYRSNVDAQTIISQNNLTTEQEIQEYVIDYIDTISTNNSVDGAGNSITSPQTYLQETYGDVNWVQRENRLTSDVSAAIPVDMYSTEFPKEDFDEAVFRSEIVSSYGGCGSIAMVGILDYFARFLNYKEILSDPTSREDRIQLATEVFKETPQHEWGAETIVFPEDYKNACNRLLKKYGLANKISCDYKGTLLFGGLKNELLNIIVEKIDNGLPVTMYVGLLSGGGVFGEHYTNIYGYQKWVGYDNNGDHHEKYLLEARINDGNSSAWYCDDNILDTGMMGIIYYDINYNHTDYFSSADFSSFVNDNGQGQYFYYNKDATVTTSYGYSFDTSRQRCSYIENQYLVLSANRSGVTDAYLELRLPVQRLTFTSALWSGMELMGINGKFTVQIYENGFWKDYIIYDVMKMSTSKNAPDSHTVLFPKGTTRIRFYAKHASPSGDRNKGRIVLDSFVVMKQ